MERKEIIAGGEETHVESQGSVAGGGVGGGKVGEMGGEDAEVGVCEDVSGAEGGGEGGSAPGDEPRKRKSRGKALLKSWQKEKNRDTSEDGFNLRAKDANGVPDWAELSEDEQKYVEMRVQQVQPTDAIRKILADNRQDKSINASRQQAFQWEKKLKPLIVEMTRADDMSEGQFEAWMRRKVEDAISRDAAGIQGKLAAIRFLKEMREERRNANQEAILLSLIRGSERLAEINKILEMGKAHGVV